MLDMKQSRPFAGGNVQITLKHHTTDSASAEFAMEAWFFSHDLAGPFLVANPSLELRVHRRMGPGSRTGTGRRLPVATGGLPQTGGLTTGGRAVIWRPFVPLTRDEIAALDELRHEEHGLRFEFELEAALVFLGPPGPRGMVAEPLLWHEGFDVTNESWRGMLTSWGWPKPRIYQLHPQSFASLEDFGSAVTSLADAERHLLLGHWADSIAHSRKVVEAVFRHLGYKEKHSMDWNAIKVEGFPAEMSALVKAFNSVTSLEHHPTGGDHRWTRADARFLLHTAAALAEYAGNLAPRRANG